MGGERRKASTRLIHPPLHPLEGHRHQSPLHFTANRALSGHPRQLAADRPQCCQYRLGESQRCLANAWRCVGPRRQRVHLGSSRSGVGDGLFRRPFWAAAGAGGLPATGSVGESALNAVQRGGPVSARPCPHRHRPGVGAHQHLCQRALRDSRCWRKRRPRPLEPADRGGLHQRLAARWLDGHDRLAPVLFAGATHLQRQPAAVARAGTCHSRQSRPQARPSRPSEHRDRDGAVSVWHQPRRLRAAQPQLLAAHLQRTVVVCAAHQH